MKVTSFLVIATFCATAASAFGLHGGRGLAKTATGVLRKPATVQAIDANSNRANTFVSTGSCGD
jgi:hypothetical protein